MTEHISGPPEPSGRDFDAEFKKAATEGQGLFATPDVGEKLLEITRARLAAEGVENKTLTTLGEPAPPVPPDLGARLTFPAATDQGVRSDFVAVAAAEGVSASEAQAAIHDLTRLPPMPPAEQGREILIKEFGAQLPLVIERAEQMLAELPPHLQAAGGEPEVFFNPRVLRQLNALWARRRGR